MKTLKELGYDKSEHSFGVHVFTKTTFGGQKTITFDNHWMCVEFALLNPLNKVEVTPAGLTDEELEAVYHEFKKYLKGEEK